MAARPLPGGSRRLCSSDPLRTIGMMRTLFLHPPSFDGFDGGAGSRDHARREIRFFLDPTWLAQPAALVPRRRLVIAPPARERPHDGVPLARAPGLPTIPTPTPPLP